MAKMTTMFVAHENTNRYLNHINVVVDFIEDACDPVHKARLRITRGDDKFQELLLSQTEITTFIDTYSPPPVPPEAPSGIAYKHLCGLKDSELIAMLGKVIAARASITLSAK